MRDDEAKAREKEKELARRAALAVSVTTQEINLRRKMADSYARNMSTENHIDC